jgi:small basic protein (TIGR04137 family)
MSRHSSLKVSGTMTSTRNVLKRHERINVLQQAGKWKKGDKVFGLPKTKAAI